MEEIWKDIDGFKGLYQISNLGRVKSLPKYIKIGHGYRFSKERILKNATDKAGFEFVVIKKDGKQYNKHIISLVNQAFVEIPKDLVDIKGFEGRYKINRQGEIYSIKSRKFLKQQLNVEGYAFVDLCKNGIDYRVPVHRLVAITFLPNPLNLPEVNHKDECRHNNCVENLEWISHIDNCNYGYHNQRVKVGVSKPVFQCDLEGNVIKRWSSMTEAEKQEGHFTSGISLCCKGKRKSYHGYKWVYAPKIKSAE